MRVLVTGGAGFIGSHLVELLQDKAAEIVVLDNLETGRLANLAGLSCRFIDASITDRQQVALAVRRMDYVFHLAAFTSVSQSIREPHRCESVNVLGLLNVLDAAAREGVRKVVFASSAAGYGNTPRNPQREDAQLQPLSPYAISKAAGESYLDHYLRQHGLQSACLRFFNVYGPRQSPSGPYAAAIPVFLRQAMRGDALTVVGDGGQTRDFVHVEDVVRAALHAALSEAVTGVFNIGSGTPTSIADLAQSIRSVTESESPIVHLPARPGEVRHSVADCSRIRSHGWSAELGIQEGLRKLANSHFQPI